MRDLFQCIALEGLANTGDLGCQHLLKFISLLETLAQRRFQFESEQFPIILLSRDPSLGTPAEKHRYTTFSYLRSSIRSIRCGRTREGMKLFFSAFYSLDLPELRTALIQAMFGDPAPLHKGSRVSELELWGVTKKLVKHWDLKDVEILT